MAVQVEEDSTMKHIMLQKISYESEAEIDKKLRAGLEEGDGDYPGLSNALDQYMELAKKGRGYPDAKVDALFADLKKRLPEMQAEWIEAHDYYLYEDKNKTKVRWLRGILGISRKLERMFATAQTRLDKVLAIDAFMHAQHVSGPFLSKAFGVDDRFFNIQINKALDLLFEGKANPRKRNPTKEFSQREINDWYKAYERVVAPGANYSERDITLAVIPRHKLERFYVSHAAGHVDMALLKEFETFLEEKIEAITENTYQALDAEGERPDEWFEQITHPQGGHAQYSEALGGLLGLFYKFKDAATQSEKVIAFDDIVNWAHGSGGVARWFVEGGLRTLNRIFDDNNLLNLHRDERNPTSFVKTYEDGDAKMIIRHTARGRRFSHGRSFAYSLEVYKQGKLIFTYGMYSDFKISELRSHLKFLGGLPMPKAFPSSHEKGAALWWDKYMAQHGYSLDKRKPTTEENPLFKSSAPSSAVMAVKVGRLVPERAIRNPMTIDDRRWVTDVLMPMFHIPALRFAWSTSTKRWPDLWIELSGTPRVTITREWCRQPLHERRKRLVHELVGHLAFGWGHMEKKGFSTYPAKDTISMAIYRDILKGAVKQPREYLK